MIHEIHKSRPTFKAILQYACDKKGAEILGGNTAGYYTGDFIKEFSFYENLNTRIKNPVFHASLSLAAGEKLDANQWQDVAKGYLNAIGIDPKKCPFVVVRHTDNGYDHVHIIASRVDSLGKAHFLRGNEKYVDKNDLDKNGKPKIKIKNVNLGYIGMKFCREYEKKHRGKYGEEKGLKTPERAKKLRASRPEKEMANRRAKAENAQTAKEYITQAIDEELEENEYDLSQESHRKLFKQRLENKGIEEVRFQKAGVSFRYDGIAYSGTKLGTDYKYRFLLERGLRIAERKDEIRKKIKKLKQEYNETYQHWIRIYPRPTGFIEKFNAVMIEIWQALCAIEREAKKYKGIAAELKELEELKKEIQEKMEMAKKEKTALETREKTEEKPQASAEKPPVVKEEPQVKAAEQKWETPAEKSQAPAQKQTAQPRAFLDINAILRQQQIRQIQAETKAEEPPKETPPPPKPVEQPAFQSAVKEEPQVKTPEQAEEMEDDWEILRNMFARWEAETPKETPPPPKPVEQPAFQPAVKEASQVKTPVQAEDTKMTEDEFAGLEESQFEKALSTTVNVEKSEETPSHLEDKKTAETKSEPLIKLDLDFLDAQVKAQTEMLDKKQKMGDDEIGRKTTWRRR